MSAYKSYLASIEMANTTRKIVEALDFRAQVDSFSAEACARCDAAGVAYRAAILARNTAEAAYKASRKPRA